MTDVFEQLLARYNEGEVPWDNELPPPEVMAAIEDLPPGRALDLGCGYGRATIFLAQRQWQVDAIDFIPQAVSEASRRATAAGVVDAITFHVGPVTEMPFLTAAYDFAVDVGCMHNLPLPQLRAYQGELQRLLRPGALYLLFAHLAATEPTDEDRAWMHEDSIVAIFAPGFRLERLELGMTQVEDQPPWRSGWFWLRRLAEEA